MKRVTALSPLEATFLEELLKTPHEQSAAFRRACVVLGRAVPKDAGGSAHSTLQREHVAEAWEEMRRTRAMRVQITTDQVLEELWGLIDVDPTIFMGDEGEGLTVLQMKALTKHQRRAIKSYTRWVDSEGRVRFKVEMWDRPKMLELAGRHTGAWAKGESLIVQGDVHQSNVVYVVGVPNKLKDAETWTKKHALPLRK